MYKYIKKWLRDFRYGKNYVKPCVCGVRLLASDHELYHQIWEEKWKQKQQKEKILKQIDWNKKIEKERKEIHDILVKDSKTKGMKCQEKMKH